jgi:hypothetical protein
MKFLFLFGALVVAALLSAAGMASAAPHHGHGGAYTCSGGVWTGDPSTSTFVSIPSNTYDSIKVTGVCDVVPDAVINVKHDIEVAPGALFNAQSAPSTITVGHDVTAGKGSLLGLGCQPDGAHSGHACAIEPDGASVITVKGEVEARNAFLVLLNGITVKRDVELTGGGGGDWAEKNNTIGGSLSIRNVTADWVGVQFNTVRHDVDLKNIWAVDPADGGFGAVYVVVNTIGHDLNCSGLGPRLSGGFIDGEVNIVGHKTTGQCVGLVGSSS